MVFKEILKSEYTYFRFAIFQKKTLNTFQTEGKWNQKCVPIFLNIFTFNHMKMEKKNEKQPWSELRSMKSVLPNHILVDILKTTRRDQAISAKRNSKSGF